MNQCKIVIVGESNSGKTSICNRFVFDSFKFNQESTIGASYSQKKINDVVLQLWDTAGQERFRSIVSIYFRNTDIVIITFDLNDIKSFNNCDFWLNMCIFEKNIPEKNILLVGCKSDLHHNVDNDKINDLCMEYNIEYLETSSLKNKNINELFFKAVSIFKDNKIKKNNIIEKNNGIIDLVGENINYIYSKCGWG